MSSDSYFVDFVKLDSKASTTGHACLLSSSPKPLHAACCWLEICSARPSENHAGLRIALWRSAWCTLRWWSGFSGAGYEIENGGGGLRRSLVVCNIIQYVPGVVIVNIRGTPFSTGDETLSFCS